LKEFFGKEAKNKNGKFKKGTQRSYNLVKLKKAILNGRTNLPKEGFGNSLNNVIHK